MDRLIRAALAASLAVAGSCGGGSAPAASTSPAAPNPTVPAVAYQPTAAKGEAPRDSAELTPQSVVEIIQSKYKPGLERCHQELLVREPTADGKVALAFTVDQEGHALVRKVKGFDAGIDDCIAQRITAWVFPPPKGKEGQRTTAAFEITLRLDGQ